MFARVHPRTRARLAAQILAPKGLVDCLVLDLSPAGAKLQVGDARWVPETFELLLKIGDCRPAKVRWRTSSEVGIAFMRDRRMFGRRDMPSAS